MTTLLNSSIMSRNSNNNEVKLKHHKFQVKIIE